MPPATLPSTGLYASVAASLDGFRENQTPLSKISQPLLIRVATKFDNAMNEDKYQIETFDKPEWFAQMYQSCSAIVNCIVDKKARAPFATWADTSGSYFWNPQMFEEDAPGEIEVPDDDDVPLLKLAKGKAKAKNPLPSGSKLTASDYILKRKSDSFHPSKTIPDKPNKTKSKTTATVELPILDRSTKGKKSSRLSGLADTSTSGRTGRLIRSKSTVEEDEEPEEKPEEEEGEEDEEAGESDSKSRPNKRRKINRPSPPPSDDESEKSIVLLAGAAAEAVRQKTNTKASPVAAKAPPTTQKPPRRKGLKIIPAFANKIVEDTRSFHTEEEETLAGTSSSRLFGPLQRFFSEGEVIEGMKLASSPQANWCTNCYGTIASNCQFVTYGVSCGTCAKSSKTNCSFALTSKERGYQRDSLASYTSKGPGMIGLILNELHNDRLLLQSAHSQVNFLERRIIGRQMSLFNIYLAIKHEGEHSVRTIFGSTDVSSAFHEFASVDIDKLVGFDDLKEELKAAQAEFSQATFFHGDMGAESIGMNIDHPLSVPQAPPKTVSPLPQVPQESPVQEMEAQATEPALV